MEFFTVENFQAYLLILVRISGLVFIAPFFGMTNTPVRVKTGFSIFLALLLFQVVDTSDISYLGTIGYAGLVIQETLVGMLVGFFANICNSILSFAGQIIDMEIGFSMVNIFDPVTKIQTTITGNFYTYFVMLILLVTNMHHYILVALVATYDVIPIGEAVFRPGMFTVMLRFMIDYFVIGFRIVLPIFGATLIVNIVLGILARVAPQMNMFVIGMQLKVFCGLIILFLIIIMLPNVAEFIFDEMDTMMKLIIKAISP